MSALGPWRFVRACALDIAVHESGPVDGPPAFPMHGFPYDVHAYAEVAPMKAARGCRVHVPYLRGDGPTRFMDAATPRGRAGLQQHRRAFCRLEQVDQARWSA